jgi:peptidoglycan/xylan/chitin deacetylase (PgdA/CDA1 family)
MTPKRLTPLHGAFFKKCFLFLLLSLSLWADAHIFVYHRFGDDKHASTNIPTEDLKKQFEYFKQHHYKVVPLHTLSQALKEKKPIPDNWVVLCIDDSYQSFYQNGLALFKAYHYPFTLFVYIEATQKSYGDFMSWQEIKEAAKYGEIGLHSYGHKHMVSLTSKAIKEDTQKAYDIFKERLGYAPKYYAYPYGEFDEHVFNEVKKFNFDLILNQNVGAVSVHSPALNLDRIALSGDVNLKHKLRIKFLDAHWKAPKSYPTNGKLNDIHVTMPASIHKAELYVTGGGWEWVKVEKGTLKVQKDYALKRRRTRVIIRANNAYSSQLIVKK